MHHPLLSRKSSPFTQVMALVLAITLGHAAQAADTATTIWSGATNTTWTTGTNWSAGAPTSGTVAEFSTTFTNQPTYTATSAAGLWLKTGVGQDVTISATNAALTLTGTATINGNANTAILLDDTANHNLSLTGGTTPIVALSNSTSFLVNNAGTLSLAKVNLAGNTLTLGGTNASGNINVTSTIGITGSTAGALIVNTAGTVTLTAANTFTGGLTLNGGTLKASASTGALGAGTLTLNGGTLDFNHSATLNFARNTTVGGNVSIISEKNTAGAGVTYTLGTLSIGANTLSIGGGNVTSGTAGVTFGATTFTGNSTFNVTNPSGGGTTLTLGALGDGGTARTLTKSGNGALTLGVAATSLVDGTTVNITGGTLTSSNATALGSLAAVSVSSGATFAPTVTQQLGSLSGAGTVTIANAQTLTVGNTSNNLSGAFSGATTATTGILKKDGSGTLTLSGSNLHTGGTNLAAGILRATTSAGALGNGALTLSAGELQLANDTGLAFGRNTTVSGATTITSDLLTSGTGVTHTLGTLAIGAQTLTIAKGSNVSGGTAGVTFTGTTTLSGSPTFSLGGGTLLTLAAVTGGANTVTFTGAGDFAQTGTWSGTGASIILASGFGGTATLGGTNTYTGGTTINAGTLQLGANAGLGSTTAGTVTFGAGSTGKLRLNGFSPTIVGLNTNATVGTPVIENGHASTASTLTVNNASASTYAGILQDGGVGTLGLTKGGAGTLTLSGASTYTGVTTITNSGGVLSVNSLADGGSSSAIGSSSNAASNLLLGNSTTLQYTGGAVSTDRLFTITGTAAATIDSSGTGAINFTNTGNIEYGTANQTRILTLSGTNTGANTLAAVIDNNGTSTTSIVKAGAGSWTLSGVNTYTGTTTLNGGTLVADTAAINGSTSTGNLVFNGGTLQAAAAGITTSKAVTLSGNGTIDTNGNSVTLSGTITSGTNTLTKIGEGSLTIRGNNNFANGGFTLNAGTLNINDNLSLSDGTGSTGTFTINGGSIDNTSGSAVVMGDTKNVWNGNFSFLGTQTIDLGIGTVSLGTAAGTTRTITTNGSINQALVVGGVISDGTTATGLTKAGNGALTLTGNNTYSGLTTLSNGTLELDGSNTSASGVKVDAGTLIIGNNAALGTGTLTMNGGHIDVSGARTTTNTQVWNGDFTFDGGNALTLGTSSANSAISLGTAAGTSRTLTIAANLLTIYGVISNGTTATALVKAGAGDLDLRATNTFSGGFTFGNGTLWLSSAGGVGTGTLTLNDGAILDNYFANGITTTNNGLVINGDFTSLGRQTSLTLGTGAGNLGTAAGTTRTISAEGGSGRLLIINNNLANGTTATGIVKAGIGDLSLGGTNTFTGGVTVNAGRLNVNSAGALGTGTLTINGGELGNLSGVTITNSNNNAQVWNGGVVYSSTATGALDLGTGAVSLGTAAGTTRTINVASQTTRPLTVGGVISDGTTATGIVKTGQSVLNLSGNNTYTGTTTVNYGTLNFSGTNSGGGMALATGDIDAGTAGTLNVTGANGKFTNTTAYAVTGGGTFQIGDSTAGNGLVNRLNTAGTLTLGGADGSGTFNIIRGSTTASSQSLVSLAVGEGNNAIGVSGVSGGIPVLTFSGATPYARSAGGFVNFAPGAVLTVNFTNAPSGAGNVASGLLVGGILNGNDFIKAQSGSLTSASYTNDAWSSGNNTTVTTSSNLSGTPSLTTGSLRFNTGGGQTLTLAGTNVIQSGGIIVTSVSGTAGTITGGSIQTGVAGGDLWAYVNGARTLTINSAITDNAGSSLSVGGGGTITLSGATTYTGRTTIGTGTTLVFDNSAGTTLNTVQGTGTLRNNNASGTLVLNQTGTGLSLATLGGVGGSTVVFSGTGDTTIRNVLGTADQTVGITGGTLTLRAGSTTAVNLLVDGGILNLATGLTINKASGTQTLTLNSGQINALSSSSLYMRANGTGATFTATQTGGTLSMTGSSQFQLGTNTSTTSTSTYNLSGGTLSYLGTGGLILYANTGGNSTSTFNLSGGKLLSAGIIQGDQGSGAKQAFVWTGGTLATAGYSAGNLTSSAGQAVVGGSTNILTNAGGTLAPGDIGTAGLTTITGNYAVTSPNAVLDIDIGGTSAASAFQQATGRYDRLTISGSGNTVTLGGRLNVRLINNYVSSGQNYTIISGASAVSGTFTNLVPDADGNTRVVLSNGLSSFTVTYGTSNVVLGNYMADNEWYGDGTPNSAIWSDATNWSVFLPSLAGHVAKFSDAAIPGAQSVNLDVNQTIGGIQFNSTTRQYSIITTGGTLTLDNNGDNSAITVVGTHNINVPVVLANNLNVTTGGAGDTLGIGGSISGAGKTLTKLGDGSLTLSGNNTYTGVTTISAGTLQIGAGGTTGSVAGDIVDNGLLVFNRSDNTAYAGAISGSGSLTQTSAGVLTLSGANTYSGGTLLNAGTLALGSAGALGSSGTIGFSGGTLQYSAANTTDYSARFSTLAGQAYSIDTNAQSVSFAAPLTSDGGSLTKLGSGTLTLSGANTYSGGTTVSAGTLATGATGNFGSGNINLLGGASLTLGNNQSISDTGTLFFSPTSTVALSFTGTELLYSVEMVGGNILSGGQTYTAAQLNAFFNVTLFTGPGSLDIASAIPEPSTWTLVAALGSGLFCAVRRRPRSKA